jgi:hypothetical protein
MPRAFGKTVADLAKSLKLPKPRKGTIRKGISKKDATTHGPLGNPWKIHELIGPEDRSHTKGGNGVVNLAASRVSMLTRFIKRNDKASKLATHKYGHEPMNLEAIVKLFWALDGRGGDAMCCEDPNHVGNRRLHLVSDNTQLCARCKRANQPLI